MLTCDVCGADFENSKACGYGVGESVLELDGLLCPSCYHRISNAGDPCAKLPIDQAKQRAQSYLANPSKCDGERKNFLAKTVSKLTQKNPNHPVLLMLKEGEYWGQENKIVKVILDPFKLTQLLLAAQDEHIYPPPPRKKKGLFGRSYVYWPNGAPTGLGPRIQISQDSNYVDYEKQSTKHVSKALTEQENVPNSYAKANLKNATCPCCGSNLTVLLAKTDSGDRYKCESCTEHFSTNMETRKISHTEVPSSIKRWEELCRQDLGFKMSYPWNWKVMFTPQGIEMLPCGNPHTFDPVLKREVASPGVNITIATGKDPTEDMVEKFVALRPNGYENYEFVQKHNLVIKNANHSAFYEFRYGEPDNKFNVMTLIAQKGNKMFVITASGKCSDFQNSRGDIWKMLHSLQLLSNSNSSVRKEEQLENRAKDDNPDPSNINRTSNGTYTSNEQWERLKKNAEINLKEFQSSNAQITETKPKFSNLEKNSDHPKANYKIDAESSARFWYNKGYDLYNEGLLEEAVACFNKALEFNPLYSNAWIGKGSALDSLRRFEEAICCFNRALEINPNDSNAWYNRSNCSESLGHLDEAIEGFNKVLELNPQDNVSWSNKGGILSKGWVAMMRQ